MKHRSKKKGHTHGKHHHRHHKHGTAASHDGDTVPATSPSLPHADAASPAGNQATETGEPRRSSICEYCGAAAVTSDGYEDDNFDCMDDCERFSSVDVNAVTCLDAYQLRSPDLTAFYCQCGVVLGEIHALLRPSNDRPSYFSECVVLQMRPKLVALFKGMWRLGVGGDLPASSAPVFESEDDYEDTSAARGGRSSPSRRGRTCPFVMVLSVLLPVLHKFLQFTQQTNPHWWLRTSTASFSSAAVLELLATQLQLHDILALVIGEGDQLAQLMEESQERDQDVAQLAQLQPLTTRGSGACSSSSSSSSSLASSHSHFGPATDRDAALGRFPQIKKISFEFDEWLAECKFELAELSEAMAENVEITALRLSRFPPLGLASDGPPKAKSTTSEFVESLMKLVLQPLSERVVTTPSASRSYIFPRVVDRCICVVIDENVVENGKWTAQAVSQFEKAIELLRTWGLSVDTEYDRQVINAPRDVARLSLLSIDAFRRLDILLHSWLRHGKDGEPYVPRLTFKTNLENLRSTLKKTMTARGNTSNGAALSGLATPPPPGQ